MALRAQRLISSAFKPDWLAHSARTALAAAASFVIARSFGLPEAYWAPVTTLIVTQSTLGASWDVSRLRLVGTALGAALAAVLGRYFHPGVALLAAGIFALGLICDWLRLDQSAYRFAGMTLTIVLLPVRNQPYWATGFHRFFEVSVGIGVALLVAAIWPRREGK